MRTRIMIKKNGASSSDENKKKKTKKNQVYREDGASETERKQRNAECMSCQVNTKRNHSKEMLFLHSDIIIILHPSLCTYGLCVI